MKLCLLGREERNFCQLREPKKFFEVARGKHNDLWEVGGSEYRDVLKQFIHSLGVDLLASLD